MDKIEKQYLATNFLRQMKIGRQIFQIMEVIWASRIPLGVAVETTQIMQTMH